MKNEVEEVKDIIRGLTYESKLDTIGEVKDDILGDMRIEKDYNLRRISKLKEEIQHLKDRNEYLISRIKTESEF